MIISKPCTRILLAFGLLLSAFCFLSFAQGGTGKLPPIRRPIGNPSRRDPNPPQLPQSKLALATVTSGGTVAGDISWRGPAPARRRIDMSADMECVRINPGFFIEDPIVRRGKLANVFVYIKDGTTADGKKLKDLSFPVPNRQVVVDQRGCVYVPHVVGIMVGEALTVTNSDPTIHNVHFTPKNNPDWNQSQPAGAAPLTHSFTWPEIMIPLKNNQHPWMKMYVGVLRHPFFAVTGEDGKFEIRDLPPGKYTLAAWHESGGGTEITRTITVSLKR